MPAAADDPARVAPRVSVVYSSGYAAFLAGPPIIRLLAEQNGIRGAFLTVLAATILGPGGIRELPGRQPRHRP